MKDWYKLRLDASKNLLLLINGRCKVQLMMLRAKRQGGVHVLLALMYLSDFILI
jgi:hypothetical protein